MSLTITIPELGKSKKSAKDLVISMLADEYPLTLAKLTNAIKRKFAASVTFQGVRRAVNHLVQDKVVEKKGKEYSLSKEWIWSLHDFAEKAQERYFSETKVRDVQALGEDIKIYTFDNLIDTDQFLNHLIGKWFEEEPGGTYLQKAGHAYFMVGNLEEENRINELMKKLKVKFYTLVGGSSQLDKWAGNYFKNQGFYYKSREGNTARYFAVYRDYVFQYETPLDLTKKIDAVCAKAKSFQDLDMVSLINLLKKKIGVKVTVMRNSLMAEQLRNSILSYFNNKNTNNQKK
ncbi:hypothetical protein AYK26_03010 [Euryarchaeota archaeon SM23-78]|nr:MAG: hypothetical protein AYK26_03010 [Euryarchaeota archaeon SM23-78]MBW3000414.1 hypothetical protein [Candidatus Woesearchaeota archaeon]